MTRCLHEIIYWSALLLLLLSVGCTSGIQQFKEPLKSPAIVKKHCELIGPARVEQISEHVWAAIGYDLANEILIHTPEGNVIVDTLMSPKRGEAARKALLASAPGGPIKAIIYTHSHIDHIGGASIWMDDNPQIWAAANFVEYFYKQYQVFLPRDNPRQASVRRPCLIGRSSLQRHRPPYRYQGRTGGAGIRLPTQTFSGSKALSFGGVTIEMMEAPGETPDQLIVWIPQDRTVIAADDFYGAFPNLYTIRGTTPRPVDDWIRSIDKIRGLKPEHLVPCHTIPVKGEKEINTTLTNYRDAIQWVRMRPSGGQTRGMTSTP